MKSPDWIGLVEASYSLEEEEDGAWRRLVLERSAPLFQPGQALLILERSDGRRAQTARGLGITREGLYKKMKRFGIE